MAVEWRAEHAEGPEIRTRRVLALVFGFLVFTTVLFGLLGAYYRTVLMSRTITVSVEQFPAPQLQLNPNQDYLDFHAAQLRELVPGGLKASADATPIGKAMAVVVARGAQAYDPPAGTPSAGPTLATGAAMDGAPRATPSPAVAPYGRGQ